MLNSLTGDFEHATVGSNPAGMYDGGGSQRFATNRMTIVNYTKVRGTRCCRFVFEVGDGYTAGDGAARCEATDFRGTAENTGQEGWYATAFYLPSGNEFGAGDVAFPNFTTWCVVAQMPHANEVGASPPCTIHAAFNRIYFQTGHTSTGYTPRYITTSTEGIIRGQWIKLIWHSTFSITTGSLQAWRSLGNSTTWTQVVNVSNIPLWRNVSSSGYRKVGLYLGQKTVRATLYHHGYVRRQNFDECAEWFGAAAPPPAETAGTVTSVGVGSAVRKLHFRNNPDRITPTAGISPREWVRRDRIFVPCDLPLPVAA